MKNSTHKISLTVLASLGMALSSHAQLNYVSGTKTLTFDGDEAGVLRFVPPITTPGVVSLSEPDGWGAIGESGRFSFISTGVTGQWPGSTSGFAAPFTSDINSNGQTDNRFDNFQTGPVASPAGGSGNFALEFGAGTWADKGYMFKIQNNSGATVTDWTLGLDTWFNDTNNNASTMRLGYATSPNNFTDSGGSLSWSGGWTELDTRVTTNSNAGVSLLETIGGTFGATVANGGFLYVGILYDMNSGGNAFTIDNLSLTAVPEVSNVLIGGLLGLGILRRRRA